jgi:hypothetical protein
MRDKEFLAEVEKAKLKITPITGEEIRTIVEDFFKIDPSLIDKLKKVVF